MRLPRQDLLDGAAFPDAMNALINSAEEVLRTWQPAWSDFLSAAVREEALSRLGHLSEVTWHSDGGYAAAERQRLFCMLRDQERPSDVPIQGLLIEGNFLFDPLSHKISAKPCWRWVRAANSRPWVRAPRWAAFAAPHGDGFA